MAQLEDIFIYEGKANETVRFLYARRARAIALLVALGCLTLYVALSFSVARQAENAPPLLSLDGLLSSSPLLLSLAASAAYVASGALSPSLDGPDEFCARINRVLKDYHLRYSPETGELRHLHAKPATRTSSSIASSSSSSSSSLRSRRHR